MGISWTWSRVARGLGSIIACWCVIFPTHLDRVSPQPCVGVLVVRQLGSNKLITSFGEVRLRIT